MRSSFRHGLGFLLVAAAFIATAAHSLPVPQRVNALPASLDGIAYDVTIDDAGSATATAVSTELPVLRYAGRSANGRHIAFTTLEALEDGSPLHRRAVKRHDVGADDELIPSGDLYIEHTRTHALRRVDLEAHYVIVAAWSPTDPSRLAYTFSSGSEFGLAIANIRTGRVDIVRQQDVLADYLAWTDTGIEFHERTGFMPATDEGFAVEHFQAAVLSPNGIRKLQAAPRGIPAATERRLFEGQGFRLHLGGFTLESDQLAGPATLELRDSQGVVIASLDAPLLQAISVEATVLSAIDEATGIEELLYIDKHGTVKTLVSKAAVPTVTYYIPYQSGSTVTVTQSGSGYSPQCSVSSHTGNRAYAYDFGGSRIEILAAASGTIAYIKSTVNCNSADTNGCADYSSSCSSNSGFGNAVIIQHADGRYTNYAHLRYGSVRPTRTGVSVSRGCQIGKQGHTGATVGNTNGCGDHLHIQRQTGSSVTSASTSIAFKDRPNPLRCTSYTANNGGMSCVF